MDSYIRNSPAGISFVGPDAVQLYRAIVLKSALGLLAKGITPTRGLTLSKALAMASEFTGKTYRRSRSDIPRARDDLHIWIETMKSSLPLDLVSQVR